MKRMTSTLILAIFILALPIQAFAGTISRTHYQRYDYVEVDLFLSFGQDRVEMVYDRTDFGGIRHEPHHIGGKENSAVTVRLYCTGTVYFRFGKTGTPFTGTGEALRITKSAVDDKSCKFSDGNPVFDLVSGGSTGGGDDGGGGGGTDPNIPPFDPDKDPPPDTGEPPPFDPEKDPPPDPGDTGGGGTEPEENPPPDACDPECRIFRCPQWDNYMGKLDNIANKIPPAPDWPKVADTFRDSIVPKLVDDIGDLLGEAPSPPAVPPELPGIDDRGIKNKEPEMKDVPGLKESGFDADKIKNEAPKIPERDDPTGGFDLSTNPMDSLPDAPENPKPGETDAGEWGKNKPKENDNPFPFPKDKGDPDVGSPPKPGDNGATPPSPGGDPGSAPKPGGNLGNGPSPGGSGGDPNMLDYKPSPGSADGSGGVIGK